MSRAWRGRGVAWRYARDGVIEAMGYVGLGIRSRRIRIERWKWRRCLEGEEKR